jgi:hypothetical protein
MDPHRSANPLPRVFIGSSSEGLAIAEHIQLGLSDETEATVWRQGVFGLSETNLESLEQAAQDFDFAVLVLTPDDVTRKRGRRNITPRDNVLFELGLFIGSLGRKRTFIVHPGDEALDLPSDLTGITAATYRTPSAGNLETAVGPVCTKIKGRIRRLIGISDSAATGPGKIKETRPLVARRRRRRSLGTACTVGPKKVHRLVDISVTGALLETDRELPVGQLLELDMSLDDCTEARVTARVVRVQYPEWGLTAGVGVAFTDYEADSEDIIKNYVAADETAGVSAERPCQR